MWAEDVDVESSLLQQADVASDLRTFLAWRRRRFPALHLRNRAAVAREMAVARGTSTYFLCSAIRDHHMFSGTPAQAAAATGAWIPNLIGFVHAQPEAALAVMGEGIRAQAHGVLDVVPGVRLSGYCNVLPAQAGQESLLGVGEIPTAEAAVDYYGIDGLHVSLNYTKVPVQNANLISATISASPTTLARSFAASWRPSVRAFLERCEIETQISRLQPVGQPAFPRFIQVGMRYAHPLAPVKLDQDGPAPRLIVAAKAERHGTLTLSVTYDPVDVVEAMDEYGPPGKRTPTGLCVTGSAVFNAVSRAMQTSSALRYYGDDFRVSAAGSLAYEPVTPTGRPGWAGTASVAWVQHFKRGSVGAFAACVFADHPPLPRFGLNLAYRV